MIEFCKNIAINIFWMLAAVFQIGLLVVLIIGILSRIFSKIAEIGEDKK